MISEIDGILFIQAHTDDVTVPADALVLVDSVKFSDCFVWVIHERIVSTVSSEVSPGQISDGSRLVVVPSLCQNKHVYGHPTGKSQHDVKKVAPC